MGRGEVRVVVDGSVGALALVLAWAGGGEGEEGGGGVRGRGATPPIRFQTCWCTISYQPGSTVRVGCSS